MTRCQQFVAGRKLFRLFSWVALAALIKLAVMGFILMDFDAGTLGNLNIARAQTDVPAAGSAPQGGPAVPPSPAGDSAQASADPKQGNQTDQSVSPPEMGPPPPGTIVSLQEALQRREQAVTQREQDIAAMEKQIDAKLADLQAMEANVKQLVDKAKSMQDQKLKHLIDVYSNMKAKQAASVIETLDESIAVRILSGMPGRQAGEILSSVNPQKAAKITEALTRMQLPPTEW